MTTVVALSKQQSHLSFPSFFPCSVRRVRAASERGRGEVAETSSLATGARFSPSGLALAVSLAFTLALALALSCRAPVRLRSAGGSSAGVHHAFLCMCVTACFVLRRTTVLALPVTTTAKWSWSRRAQQLLPCSCSCSFRVCLCLGFSCLVSRVSCVSCSWS